MSMDIIAHIIKDGIKKVILDLDLPKKTLPCV